MVYVALQVLLCQEIAVQIGNEKAVRAVGAANGKNPISIIAPCHRVIGAGAPWSVLLVVLIRKIFY